MKDKVYTYFCKSTKSTIKVTADNKRQAVGYITHTLNTSSDDLVCLGINL